VPDEQDDGAKRPKATPAQMVVQTSAATLLAAIGASVVSNEVTGNRDAVLELRLQKWVREEFVDKGRSEDRANVLQSDMQRLSTTLERMRLDLMEIQSGIPRIEAKLETLDERAKATK
jgi:phage shock protein A